MTTSGNTVAVIGTGVIGTSWIAGFLSAGCRVRAFDPAVGAEERARDRLRGFLPAGVSLDAVTFHADPVEAAAGVTLVQENGPEDLGTKRALFAELDAASDPEVILATSSSGLLASDLQRACVREPGRVLVAHPFNPPHLIPLVEIVPGAATSTRQCEVAMAFYRAVGKTPILVRREIPGHVANRLQAALWREAFAMIGSGVATAEDIDLVMTAAIGPRWTILGPFATLALSGGEGGMAALLEKLGEAIDGWWGDLSDIRLDAALAEKVAAQTDEALASISGVELAAIRDGRLPEALSLRVDIPKGTE